MKNLFLSAVLALGLSPIALANAADDSSTSTRNAGYTPGGYEDPCYYDYTTHYHHATYPYILDSQYNDDYQRPPYKPGKRYPELDCY